MKHFALLLLAFGAVAAVRADVQIDDFTSGAGDVKSNLGNWNQDMNGTMIGGTRTVGFYNYANPYGTYDEFSSGGTGYGAFAMGSGLYGNVGFGYGYHATADGSGFTTFDLAADFSSDSKFEMSFAYVEDAMSGVVLLNGSQSANFTVGASGGPETVDVDFSSFTGVDFSNVHQIDFVFEGMTANDFVVSDFKATGTPEPASFAVLGLGAVGLLARRRRR